MSNHPSAHRVKPNRTTGQLVDRSRALAVLEAAQEAGVGAGVIHIDLDRFHRVNQQWGQRVGDQVLQLLAPRLALRLPPQGFVASLKGDSYIVVVPGVDGDRTRQIAEDLLGAVREPIAVSTTIVSVRASAGIACQVPGADAVDVVEHAFLACRRAKLSGSESVVGYEDALGLEADQRQQFEDDVRRAIALGEFRLHLQPEVDLQDGEVTSVEALIRWIHPTKGLIPPSQFLPEAEAAGLMSTIGDWVVDEAIDLAEQCRQLRHGDPLRIWVNLAAEQLADGRTLVERVHAAITSGRITASCIGFEVTESSLLEDLPGAVGLLQKLRELGVEIALDDFGTGYSSLSYLRQLPVTAVKIDRQFVAGIGGSLADEAIVEAVIDLAHALGLRVIAEGIEEVAQVDALIRMGADQAQGYHFGRPAPIEELLPLLALPWCGAPAPTETSDDVDRRADQLPGFGSPRARLLLAAFDTARDSIIVTAAAGGDESGPPIVYVNAAFEEETGFRSTEVIGKTVSMLLTEPPNADVLAWFAELHRDGRAATTEMANRRSDGTTFLCESTVSPISDERGIHTHWLHVRRDLTQRLAAEGDRARFQGLIEQTTSLVFLAETGGKWVYANAAQRRAIGLRLDAPLDGVTSETAFSAEQRRQIAEEVRPALEQTQTWQGETSFVNPLTGERTEVIADVQYFDDPLRPGVRFFASVSRDVTQINALERAEGRRRELGSFAANLARAALDQSGEEFLDSLDSVLASFGRIVMADFVFLDHIDVHRHVLRPIGTWKTDRFDTPTPPPQEMSLDLLPHWVERLSQGGAIDEWRPDDTPWSVELRAAFPEAAGGVSRAAPLRVGGVLLGVLGMANIDIDHRWSDDEAELLRQVADTVANLLGRNRAADALRTSESCMAAMLANVSEILVVVDREGWIRYSNPRIETDLGFQPADMIGRHFLSMLHPDDQDQAVEAFALTLDGQDSGVTEVRVRAADNTWHWYDVGTSGVDDPLVGGYMMSLRDISGVRAQKDAADRLARFERMLLSLSQWALQVQPGEIINGLHAQLEQLGRTLDADAAFASLIEADRFRNVAGWSAHGSYALGNDDLPLPRLIARYATHEPLVVDDIDRFDDDWVDEWRSFPVCDRAGLSVPLVSGGKSLGVLGVVMQYEPRPWRDDEIAVMRRVSQTVAALLDRHQVEASLRQGETRLAALLDGSHDLVAVIDDHGVIQYTNRAVVRSLGYGREELLGRSVLSIVHPDDADLVVRRLGTLRSELATLVTVVRLVAVDGRVGSWEITMGDLRDPIAGGRVITCRDVTARLASAAAASDWVELLRFAFDVAQSALDLEAPRFVERLPDVCLGIAELLGVDFVYVDQLDEERAMLINLAGWVGPNATHTVHPGDCTAFDAVPAWVELLRRNEPITATDASHEDEQWAREKSAAMGAEGALMAMGMSSAGKLVGVLGVSSAASARKWTDDEISFLRIVAETIAHVLERAQLDEALRMSEARFRLLSETAADLVLLVDIDGVIVYASPSCRELLGFTSEELVGRHSGSIVHPADRDLLVRTAPKLLDVGTLTSEIRMIRADGSSVWVANSASTVVDPVTGDAVEFRVSVRDITDRKRLEEQLAGQALHDPLTGLGNRILLQARLEAAVSRRDPQNDVSVLLLDLDGFKEVNDTHGHAMGDEVLRVVAERLRRITRNGDTVARTGGDEFVLLCPETAERVAIAVARRLVEAIRAPIKVGDVIVRLGASVGVAHQRGTGIDPDSLLIQADHAMYDAKRAGRDRVSVATSMTGPPGL